MKDVLKVGIIVADTCEYEPVQEYAEDYLAERRDFYSRMGHAFKIAGDRGIIEVQTVLCGIGMVNAAAAAAWLANECDIIINTGFSGGLWGCEPGDVVAGEQYIEHDFDLTGIGYEPGMKPDQASVYECDYTLMNYFCNIAPEVKCGVMASGDHFVCDDAEAAKIKRLWNAMACDMESAAAAYVANLAGKRFIAVRQISDSADSDAADTYNESKEQCNKSAFQIVSEGLEGFFDVEELWN